MKNSNISPATAASALYTICTVWFFWGFVAASNGVFIPFCKSHFQLNQFQSQLIEFAFYGAYFIGSLILWLWSQITGIDILNKLGYKNAIILGLGISIIGALGIIPSVHLGSFNLILLSFFVVALGFSMQQVASQPYIIALGPPESGTHRISLAGAVNSIGTLLGPLVVSFIIFGKVGAANTSASITSIDTMYVVLAIVFGAAIALLWFSKLPEITNDEPFERGLGALKYPQLVLGMIAIFVYVGVEVTIQSNMGELLKQEAFGGYSTAQIGSFISLYWGSLMIGRMTGALSAFNISKGLQNVLTFLVPIIGFLLILGVNMLNGNEVSEFYPYILCVILLAAGILFANRRPFILLLVLSGFGMAAMGIGLFFSGKFALYALISGGLCCSVMWPCIFPSGIAGLGKYTNQGASFLIMMILGGAIIPPLQGAISDSFGIHLSYIVPLLGFGYLAFFALRVKKVLKDQGLDFDNMQSGGGH
ncbi:MAG: MFS transporter [Bacteroidota bacterium]|nr:MFS transporter [Bacteroidota bacterium]